MEMTMKKLLVLTVLGCVAVVVGCSQGTSTTPSSTPTVDLSKFLLTEEPDGATGVIRIREEAKDGDDVVLVGRIGGDANPWIDGRAAFSIVDGSLKACSDIPGDTCEKPWDYCCETHKLPTSTAFIKVVDDNGSLVKADAKGLLGVKELSTIVVTGKAQRDDAGNLTVLATGVYVKKK
jgi:hypothetical protein